MIFYSAGLPHSQRFCLLKKEAVLAQFSKQSLVKRLQCSQTICTPTCWLLCLWAVNKCCSRLSFKHLEANLMSLLESWQKRCEEVYEQPGWPMMSAAVNSVQSGKNSFFEWLDLYCNVHIRPQYISRGRGKQWRSGDSYIIASALSTPGSDHTYLRALP